MSSPKPIEQRLAALLNGQGYALRLKTKNETEPVSWGQWLGVPVPGYIEINGPWPVREVEWVEVNPVVTTFQGRLIPPQVADHTADLTRQLKSASLSFSVTNDGYLRILLSPR
ncbi:DUF6678 family protein [Hymenobacter sp. CRA2]|uniref:DUF6678 family protein n=1 Tax=Hymenobacter sp. CRA2 TaxID=1955620 RepID=UPI00098FDBA4|nr:DUF6678 family protein [Hymenobacter sp. CRA2]OON67425.1 hypothetical protein B0919_18350 [Hymenobacter sp. CRA2]